MLLYSGAQRYEAACHYLTLTDLTAVADLCEANMSDYRYLWGSDSRNRGQMHKFNECAQVKAMSALS